ncbi:GNAT family N-acetyltransferase [Hymenobacter cheonanensis]|uniref:GNAT family N-acetyltransferase n=1 Tax=Hymenobacter sp. CA2-7 TaxID=3063993 RepID=UPI002712992C|nr:GNAT family N-acetyltransferase [Hymenobacter sp. CA2-7]MDO7887154.1 GNAT family N-acetyltransferase [Hymenobacter sp. CA2-7]
MTIPVLETARLRLRAYQAADLAPLLAMWQQPQFYQYITGQPATEADVWPRLLRDTGLWVVCGFGYWAIEEKATGEYVGAVGFADFRRDIVPALAWPEAGWSLAPHAHGRGYATEALGAALAWGDAHLPQPRTVCIISPDNQPSLRLATRLGYQEVGRTTFKNQPVVVLERLAPA